MAHCDAPIADRTVGLGFGDRGKFLQRFGIPERVQGPDRVLEGFLGVRTARSREIDLFDNFCSGIFCSGIRAPRVASAAQAARRRRDWQKFDDAPWQYSPQSSSLARSTVEGRNARMCEVVHTRREKLQE